MPIPLLQLQRKPVLCREAVGLVTELWSPRCFTMQWLCSHLCYETAANQWTIVEIELLATVRWKWGCQPFSCQCSKNVIHFPKEICWHVCLRNPCLPFDPFVKSKPPLTTRSLSSREPQYLPPALHYVMVASCPFLCCSCRKKTYLIRTSRGFGHGVVVSRICYNAVMMLSVVLCDCCTPTNTCRDWDLATVRWKWGRQPFSCQCLKNVIHSRKEIYATCLSKESIRAIRSGNSKHPLPTRSLRFLRAAVCSTSSAFCLHHAHPFVAAAGKTSLTQGGRGFGHGVVVSKIRLCSQLCYDIWAFSNSGLEVGLPAFQLPMSENCDSLPKGDLFDMFVSGIHSRHSFLEFQASSPYQKLEVPESDSTLHQLGVMAASCPSIRCSCRKKTSHVITAN